MNEALYEAWKKRHRIDTGEVDLSDAVMHRIVQKQSQSSLLERVWEGFVLQLYQASGMIRVSLLFVGALVGALRLACQMASILFM